MKTMNGFKNKENFIKENILFFILIFLSLGLIILNQYEKLNNGEIKIIVNENRDISFNEKEYMKKIDIFVYNPNLKIVELKEVELPKRDLLEGEYVAEIIALSSYLNEKMKFLSSYILNIDGVETMIIKVNNEFLDIKKNNELYNGFIESIKKTMVNVNNNIQEIQIQIDGDKVTQ